MRRCVSKVNISLGMLKALSGIALGAAGTARLEINAKRRIYEERMKGRYLVGFASIPHAEKLTMPREDAAKMGFAYLRRTTLEIASALARESKNARFFARIFARRDEAALGLRISMRS